MFYVYGNAEYLMQHYPSGTQFCSKQNWVPIG